LNKQFLSYVAIGLSLVVVAIAAIFYIQRGAHIELKGAILKVRTLAADERSSVAVIDFRFVNPADYPFIVRRVEVFMEDQEGRVLEGATVADVDAERLFEYFPLLGQKYNDSLVIRTRVEPRESMDRMVAVRFEIPEAGLEARNRLLVRVEDVDGAISEIVEEGRR
jgi:hypothetical protein